jgi:hypothetical protein
MRRARSRATKDTKKLEVGNLVEVLMVRKIVIALVATAVIALVPSGASDRRDFGGGGFRWWAAFTGAVLAEVAGSAAAGAVAGEVVAGDGVDRPLGFWASALV